MGHLACIHQRLAAKHVARQLGAVMGTQRCNSAAPRRVACKCRLRRVRQLSAGHSDGATRREAQPHDTVGSRHSSALLLAGGADHPHPAGRARLDAGRRHVIEAGNECVVATTMHRRSCTEQVCKRTRVIVGDGACGTHEATGRVSSSGNHSVVSPCRAASDFPGPQRRTAASIIREHDANGSGRRCRHRRNFGHERSRLHRGAGQQSVLTQRHPNGRHVFVNVARRCVGDTGGSGGHCVRVGRRLLQHGHGHAGERSEEGLEMNERAECSIRTWNGGNEWRLDERHTACAPTRDFDGAAAATDGNGVGIHVRITTATDDLHSINHARLAT